MVDGVGTKFWGVIRMCGHGTIRDLVLLVSQFWRREQGVCVVRPGGIASQACT